MDRVVEIRWITADRLGIEVRLVIRCERHICRVGNRNFSLNDLPWRFRAADAAAMLRGSGGRLRTWCGIT